MKYDELVIHFRRQTFYDDEVYQAEIRASPLGFLGGPFRPPRRRQDPAAGAWTAEKVRKLQAGHQRAMEVYWRQVAAGETLDALTVSDHHLVALGLDLYHALPDTVQATLEGALQQAVRKGRGLRLVLEATEEARFLLQLPWELVYSPAAGHFLGLSNTLSIVRRDPDAFPRCRLRLNLPLHVLMVVSDPQDLALYRLDAAVATLHGLESALAGQMAFTWIEGPDTAAQLRSRLDSATYPVILFFGHGDLGAGRGHLLFEDNQRRACRVPAEFLRLFFDQAAGTELVVLMACRSGSSVPDQPEARVSITDALLHAGFPAIVSMQGEMGVEAAALFGQTLLQALGRGNSLDAAVSRARQTVRAALYDPVNWSIPVVYHQVRTPLQPTWYERLADWLGDRFPGPGFVRSARGTLVAALLFLLTGLATWPAVGGRESPPGPGLAVAAVALWAAVLPGLMALFHHPDQGHLPPAQRYAFGELLVYKILGAYSGEFVGLAFALAGLGVLYYSHLWDFLPLAVRWPLWLAALSFTLLLAYSSMRSTLRGLLAIAEVGKLTVTRRDLVLLALPLVPLAAGRLFYAYRDLLLSQGLGGLLLSALLLVLIVVFPTQSRAQRSPPAGRAKPPPVRREN